MEVRYLQWFVIGLVCCVSNNRVHGAVHQTLTHCCDLGKNYANSDVACTTIKPPFTGVESKDEGSCLPTLMICCQAQNKENECRLGINDAEVGTCNSASGSERQSCCEACNLGKLASASGSCESSFSLGASYDKQYKNCCQKHLPRTTTLKAENMIQNEPEISLGNLCEIEDLCAQICIPTGTSYKCDCNPGYTLMADGNSCKEITGPKSNPKKKSKCDSSNPCAHDCHDTGISIYCTCYEGYELQPDKRSCKDIDECTLDHDCHANETCVNQEGYYECVEEGDEDDYEIIDCKPGFRFSWENKICEDINECLLPLTCLPSQKCINTEGSYNCTGGDVVCPTGYFFKASTQDCADVDECVTGDNDCNRESQVCLNNKGGYTCVDKASKTTCPAGFMMNPMLQICVDIDECAQDIPLCAADELCVNEEGGHNCVTMGSGPKAVSPTATTIFTSTATTTTTTIPTTTKATTPKAITRITTTKPPTKPTTKPTTTTVKTTPPTSTTKATTIKSTTTSTTTTTTTTPKPTKPSTIRISPVFITATKPTTRKPFTPPTFKKPPPISCNRGYTYSDVSEQCEDIDECTSGINNCDNYQVCHNTLGSYLCNCKIGFQKDPITGACQDINECQLQRNDCIEGQRCDNTVGSYLCSRVANCGTGYTLNYETGVCEDNDECALGTHNCDIGGRNLICRNTHGSFRCDRPYVPLLPPPPRPTRPSRVLTIKPPSAPPTLPLRPTPFPPIFIPLATQSKPLSHSPTGRPITLLRPNKYPTYPMYPNYTIISSQSKKCLPGYFMDGAGQCQDLDECQSNPCPRSHQCLNNIGRYECKPKLICTAGFELNSSGDSCIDVNECLRGNHTCDPSEICKNYFGYYRCECPAGHIKEGKKCVDIDECKFYKGRACLYTADCVNTIGSYECQCKEGFQKVNDKCIDIDECKEEGKCGSKCHNTMGSFRCYCEKGFTLNNDNRTCSDVDECSLFSSQIHCVGTCINSPGSYQCGCPSGYRLGTDGHTCQDIDECSSNQGDPCKGPDQFCFNTRGSYECASIACPKNYIRDHHQKSRCKLDAEHCRHFGECSLHLADQISYHFFNIVSNYTILNEPVKLFKMRGPQNQYSRVAFKLDVRNIRCPFGVRPASDSDFWLDNQYNSVTIAIKNSIQGPQQVELTLQMQIFNHNQLTNSVISKIMLYVSQFKF